MNPAVKIRNKILYEFNKRGVEYPKHKLIHEFFEEQVNRTPDKIALIFEDKKITYRELNEQSNQLARYLREYDVQPDLPIGIILDISIELISVSSPQSRQ